MHTVSTAAHNFRRQICRFVNGRCHRLRSMATKTLAVTYYLHTGPVFQKPDAGRASVMVASTVSVDNDRLRNGKFRRRTPLPNYLSEKPYLQTCILSLQ